MNQNKIECPVCDGYGVICYGQLLGQEDCHSCLGTGSIPKWPTPEEWERIYPDRPLQDDDVVWVFYNTKWLAVTMDVAVDCPPARSVVAVPGFGKPPADYRPEVNDG